MTAATRSIPEQRADLQRRRSALDEERRGLSVPWAAGDQAARGRVAELSTEINTIGAEIELLDLAEQEQRRQDQEAAQQRKAAERVAAQDRLSALSAQRDATLATVDRLAGDLQAEFTALVAQCHALDLLAMQLDARPPVVTWGQRTIGELAQRLGPVLHGAGLSLRGGG